MRVLVIGKFQGDTAKFRQSLTERAAEYERWGERARAAGATHHRYGVGDGHVVVSDEWESVEHFEKFFANPEIQAFIGSIGAAPAPPEMIIVEAVSSPDQF
jgi:quinol monooxygenase YgiN